MYCNHPESTDARVRGSWQRQTFLPGPPDDLCNCERHMHSRSFVSSMLRATHHSPSSSHSPQDVKVGGQNGRIGITGKSRESFPTTGLTGERRSSGERDGGGGQGRERQ